MLENSESNVLGCFFIASARAMPDWTSSRTFKMTAEKFLCGSCLPRISRHCTSGRPASIMTEDYRVKMARLFAGTALPPLGPAGLAALATFAALAASIRVTMICSRLNAATAASIVSATRSPVTDCPALVRPEYANVGINSVPSSQLPVPAPQSTFKLETGDWKLETQKNYL